MKFKNSSIKKSDSIIIQRDKVIEIHFMGKVWNQTELMKLKVFLSCQIEDAWG